MPRVTLGHLMVAVAGLAVVLGAFRVHISLGSLLFGFFSIGWLRISRRAAAERAVGRAVSRPDLLAEFGAAIVTTALMMAIVAAPALFWPWFRARRSHEWFSMDIAVRGSIFCSLVGWALLRLSGRNYRDRVPRCGRGLATVRFPQRSGQPRPAPPRESEHMASEASGTFEVTLTPQPGTLGVGDPAVGRIALDKRFAGGLEGTSRGEMLTGTTATPGSAGYVAIERVVATLDGRRGSFLLQHSGTLDRGQPTLSVAVVPDSGTEELTGLTGTMTLERVDGTHSYRLRYDLPVERTTDRP